MRITSPYDMNEFPEMDLFQFMVISSIKLSQWFTEKTLTSCEKKIVRICHDDRLKQRGLPQELMFFLFIDFQCLRSVEFLLYKHSKIWLNSVTSDLNKKKNKKQTKESTKMRHIFVPVVIYFCKQYADQVKFSKSFSVPRSFRDE